MDIKPTPLNRREFTSKLIDPYLESEGKPIPPGILNRGEQVSVKNDTTKVITIGLIDIDTAVQYYFENVIKPNIIQNGERIAVPVFISSPERFKSVQTDGFYRDKNGKIMLPLITYKRNSVAKNRDLGNKLDGNTPHNLITFQQKFDKRNIYDNFSAINNIQPQIARSVTIVPDYVTLIYSCIMFTNYVEQSNGLIESMQFASDSYWGDQNKFTFKSKIDTFNTATILTEGEDRGVKVTFDITLNGYLIPATLNKELAQVQNRSYDKSQITVSFNEHI